MKEIINLELAEHLSAINELHDIFNDVEETAISCIRCLKEGGKILIFGNGGSASDAQHFAAELAGRYRVNRKGLSAIALTTDTSLITSVGNDFGFDMIFERQVEAIANKGDIVIGISTSGTSTNVIRGLKLASKIKCKTIGFTGKDSKSLDKICDVTLAAPSLNTARIQEMHILIIHIICHVIDQEFKS